MESESEENAGNRVRLNVVITRQLDNRLEELAERQGTNKSEILKKALALYDYAAEAKTKGNGVGIISNDGQVLTEIVGI